MLWTECRSCKVLAPRRDNHKCSPNHSPMDVCRSAHLHRYSLGATPISRLKTRLIQLSDPYPPAESTSANDVFFERLIAPRVYTPHPFSSSSSSFSHPSLTF